MNLIESYTLSEALEAVMNQILMQILLVMLAFWVLSVFLGSFVAVKIDATQPLRSAIIVGVLLLAGAIMNMVHIPHPLWMMIASCALYLPLAYLGTHLASPSASP